MANTLLTLVPVKNIVSPMMDFGSARTIGPNFWMSVTDAIQGPWHRKYNYSPILGTKQVKL